MQTQTDATRWHRLQRTDQNINHEIGLQHYIIFTLWCLIKQKISKQAPLTNSSAWNYDTVKNQRWADLTKKIADSNLKANNLIN